MANKNVQRELIAELAVSRDAISGAVVALRRDVDFGAKLKSSYRGQPTAWLVGSALLGLLLSKLIPTRKKVEVQGHSSLSDPVKTAGKGAIIISVLKFAFDFARPALFRWVNDRYLNQNRRSNPFP